jgi:hypothetical protein
MTVNRVLTQIAVLIGRLVLLPGRQTWTETGVLLLSTEIKSSLCVKN